MRLFFLLIISLFLQYSYAQTKALNYKVDTKNKRSKKTTYSLQNSKNDDIAFLILDRKTIHANLFDKRFKAISKFSFEAPKKKYEDPLGYTVNGKRYHLLYADQSFSKTLLVSLDFEGKIATAQNLDFKLNDDELYVDTIIHNNEFLFLTLIDDNFIIRKLSTNNTLEIVKEIAVEQNDKKGFILEINNELLFPFGSTNKTSNIVKIDHRIPSSIEQASSPNKLFKFNDLLMLSVEIEDKGTLVYNIDLTTFNVTQNTYSYPKGKIDDFKVYNSFIYDDKIFQIASSRKEMNFSVKDLNDNLIKVYYLNKDQPISFKNGPIIQEGQTALPFQTVRKLEATSKFLRKISSGNIGVSVIKVDHLYEITIGGFKLVTNMSPGFGTPTATFDAGTNTFVNTFNPTFYNYNSYTTTKATFFDTVMTDNFEPVKKKFEPGLNNKIDAYMGDYKGITGEDVFFKNNIPYYAYFNLKQTEFNLVKF